MCGGGDDDDVYVCEGESGEEGKEREWEGKRENPSTSEGWRTTSGVIFRNFGPLL